MTSNINFAAINENFPVAGQDNDTQVFRDNFDTIKTNFQEAKTEIEDLQENVVRKDSENDFNNNTIVNAKLLNVVEVVNPPQMFEPSPGVYPLEYANGSYQILTFDSPTFNLQLQNFFAADSGSVAKMTVEMYSKTSTTVAFQLSGSLTIKKSSNWPGTLTVSSTDDPIIIEIWKHNEETIFMNYLGQFS